MVDMGDRFRLICADIELVKQPEPMPKLPVARVMWKILPDFATGAEKWIYAGGAHHAVVSTALTTDDIRLTPPDVVSPLLLKLRTDTFLYPLACKACSNLV